MESQGSPLEPTAGENHKENLTVSAKTLLKCLYTNADTLTNKLAELETIITIESPDLIVVTEVVPKNCRTPICGPELNIKGYASWHNLNEVNNSEPPNGRGIIIYTLNELMVNPENITAESVREAIFVTIKLLGRGDTLLVGAFYRSPNSSPENNLALCNLLKSLGPASKYSHMLLLGDFNYKSIDWQTGTIHSNYNDEELFYDSVQDAYLYQHVQEPTRARGTRIQPSLIDLIFTNEETMVSEIKFHSPLGSSDHCVITFNYLCYTEIKDVSKKSKFVYDRGNYEALKNDLKDRWSDISGDDYDIDSLYHLFLEHYNSLVENHIPQTQRVISTQTCELKPYLGHHVKSQIKIRQRRWTRYLETRCPVKYEQYKTQRNYVKKLTKKALKQAQKDLAKKIKGNPKRFWAHVNSKRKTRETIPELISNNKSRKATTDIDKAETLSKYFQSVFVKEDCSSMPSSSKILGSKNYVRRLVVSEAVVFKKLTELNVNKSVGPDGVHPRVLKEAAEEFAKLLTIIFNKSLKSQTVPQIWKEAHVTPIHKKGSKSHAQNYRPISLTSVVCKVFESIIRDHMMEFLVEEQFLSNKQYGFMPKRSTTLQLLKVFDEWSEIIDEGGQVDCVYLDFQKAFDSVPHHRLLEKLKHIGITGELHGWIQNYLLNRTQRVIVNGVLSDIVEILSGVPQGSVLGPLLFLIYINDLPSFVISESYLFADDTKIFRCIEGKSDQSLLQSDLNSLSEWSNNWLLEFNADKCKSIHFGKQLHTDKSYYLMDKEGYKHELKKVEFEKDIGVITDQKMDFEYHIAEKVKKANQIMGTIRRSFKYMNEEMFVILYTSLVRPHLEYASSVWRPYKIKYIEQLETVQRRATKQIKSLQHLEYADRLKRLNMFSLSFRRLRGDMIEVFKIVNGIYDSDVTPQLTFSKNTRSRGNLLKLEIPKSKQNSRKNFFTVRVCKYWNSLPNEVIFCINVNEFKHKLDKFWREHPLKFNHLDTTYAQII